MKKERRTEVRWPAPRSWTKPIQKMTLADETPKRDREERVEIAPPDHFDEILAPSWAWRMLHKS